MRRVDDCAATQMPAVGRFAAERLRVDVCNDTAAESIRSRRRKPFSTMKHARIAGGDFDSARHCVRSAGSSLRGYIPKRARMSSGRVGGSSGIGPMLMCGR